MFKNILSVLILQGSNYLLPLITLPYLTRTLGVEKFGLYGYVFALVQYFIIFIDFGFNLTATKMIAENNGDDAKQSEIFWSTMISKLLLFTVAIIFLYLLSGFIIDSGMLLLYSLPMLLGAVLFPLWYFQGIENMRIVAILSIVSKLVTLPTIFLFVQDSTDLKFAILIQSSSLLILGILSLSYVLTKRNINFSYQNISWKDIKRAVLQSSPIFLASVSISVYTISSTIILAHFSDLEQVSLFTAGERIKNAILSAMLILGNVFYPRVIILLKENRFSAFSLIKKISFLQLVICSILAIFFMFYSEAFSIFIFGKDYAESGKVLFAFSLVYLFVMQSTVMGNYILLPLGYNKIYTILPMITVVLHVPLCIYLSKIYGAKGAAYSILMSEMVSFISLLIVFYKFNLLKKLTS